MKLSYASVLASNLPHQTVESGVKRAIEQILVYENLSEKKTVLFFFGFTRRTSFRILVAEATRMRTQLVQTFSLNLRCFTMSSFRATRRGSVVTSVSMALSTRTKKRFRRRRSSMPTFVFGVRRSDVEQASTAGDLMHFYKDVHQVHPEIA